MESKSKVNSVLAEVESELSAIRSSLKRLEEVLVKSNPENTNNETGVDEETSTVYVKLEHGDEVGDEDANIFTLLQKIKDQDSKIDRLQKTNKLISKKLNDSNTKNKKLKSKISLLESTIIQLESNLELEKTKIHNNNNSKNNKGKDTEFDNDDENDSDVALRSYSQEIGSPFYHATLLSSPEISQNGQTNGKNKTAEDDIFLSPTRIKHFRRSSSTNGKENNNTGSSPIPHAVPPSSPEITSKSTRDEISQLNNSNNFNSLFPPSFDLRGSTHTNNNLNFPSVKRRQHGEKTKNLLEKSKSTISVLTDLSSDDTKAQTSSSVGSLNDEMILNSKKNYKKIDNKNGLLDLSQSTKTVNKRHSLVQTQSQRTEVSQSQKSTETEANSLNKLSGYNKTIDNLCDDIIESSDIENDDQLIDINVLQEFNSDNNISLYHNEDGFEMSIPNKHNRAHNDNDNNIENDTKRQRQSYDSNHEDKDTSNNKENMIPSMNGKPIDLTKNPIYNRNWYPEDFKVNPVVNFNKNYAFQANKIALKSVHPSIRSLHDYERNFILNQQLSKFNKLSGMNNSNDHDHDKSDQQRRFVIDKDTNAVGLVSSTKAGASHGLKSIEKALYNERIHPIFKYQKSAINNMSKTTTEETNNSDNNNINNNYNKTIMNLKVSTKTTKLWERPDSPPGFSRSDFPTTQERANDRLKSEKLETIKALKRLFHAVYMVEPINKQKDLNDNSNNNDNKYIQAGKFIFKNELLNQCIRNDNFTIDESIFSYN
ncbi:hypothetical protein B5S33_g2327 [[Candida] boidinii]|nr:hypothetical protein B5S30_g3672 [[Candida] boidinii]OWB83696.1 hypothetical protein B5S33_g2327 [[Candida] boidinii]GMG08037.1 unnamed protein product [[Candida] boidinii]